MFGLLGADAVTLLCRNQAYFLARPWSCKTGNLESWQAPQADLLPGPGETVQLCPSEESREVEMPLAR